MKKKSLIILIIISSFFGNSTEFKSIDKEIEFKEKSHFFIKKPLVKTIDLEVENQIEFYSIFRISFNEELIKKIYKITNSYKIEIRAEVLRSKFDLAVRNISTISPNGLIDADFVMKLELYKNNKKIKFETLKGIVVSYNISEQYYSRRKLYCNTAQAENETLWNLPKEIEISDFKIKQSIREKYTYSRGNKGRSIEEITYDTSYHKYRAVTLKPEFKDWILVGNEISIDEENTSEISFEIQGLEKDTRIGIILDNYEYNSYQALQANGNIYSTFISEKYYSNTTPKVSIISTRSNVDTFYFAKYQPKVTDVSPLNLTYSKILFIKKGNFCGLSKDSEMYGY